MLERKGQGGVAEKLAQEKEEEQEGRERRADG